MDYETISDELFELSFELEGADEATVRQHMERLQGSTAGLSGAAGRACRPGSRRS